jgi:hypothetical protein
MRGIRSRSHDRIDDDDDGGHASFEGHNSTPECRAMARRSIGTNEEAIST